MTDALCVVHSQPASDSCSRCGSFVCETCAVDSTRQDHCERCAELLSPLELRAARAQRRASHAVTTMFLGAVSILAGMLGDFWPLMVLGAVLGLLASALGAGALLLGRGTKAKQVVVQSVVAIGLGLAPAAMFAYRVSLASGM